MINPVIKSNMISIHKYEKLHSGTLLKRYKRFLAEIRLPEGQVLAAFSPNTGSMKTCSDPGSPVMLSHQKKEGRKTEYTLEMVKTGETWVGVNTLLANKLAATIIDLGLLDHAGLKGFRVKKREYSYRDSRLDLLLAHNKNRCLAEVKNVTLREGNAAQFPDAVTTRGKKHLETLIFGLSEGYSTCMLYVIQRSDCSLFGPAHTIDPAYSDTLWSAAEAGVKIIPVSLHVTPTEIFYCKTLPMEV